MSADACLILSKSLYDHLELDWKELLLYAGELVVQLPWLFVAPVTEEGMHSM